MTNLFTPQRCRLFAAVVAGLAGMTAILLVQWPAWPIALSGGTLRLPWQVDGWSQVLIDSQGRIGPDIARSFLLGAITLLTGATVVVAGFDILRPPADDKILRDAILRVAPAAPRAAGAAGAMAQPSEELVAEMHLVIQQLRSFLEANGSFANALTQANAKLPGLVTADQVRLVLSFLILENEKMRSRTRELSASLDVSRRQIESLKGNLAEAKAEGLTDALTGLKNRRAFDLTLAGELSVARAAGKPLSLIMADIDRFKTINDQFGHAAGDDLLRWLSKIFAVNVKGRDTAARYGGEELALILPQTALRDAVTLADQIRRQIEATPWHVPDAGRTPVSVTSSFGVAEVLSSESTEALLRRVDAKLYEAKRAGRNRVCA